MELGDLFARAEQQYGLPSGYLERTARLESSMDPNARNPNSSAGGLFQFIDGTAKAYGLADRFDPVAATDAAARLARDNQRFLTTRLGRDVTPAELYLAHQQGGGGAYKLLSNPSAAVGGDAIALNGGVSGQTGGAFANHWIDKFNGGGGGGIASAFANKHGSAVQPGEGQAPLSFGPIGAGPAAPAIGNMAASMMTDMREKQAARQAEDKARRAALFGAPSGGIGSLYGN